MSASSLIKNKTYVEMNWVQPEMSSQPTWWVPTHRETQLYDKLEKQTRIRSHNEIMEHHFPRSVPYSKILCMFTQKQVQWESLPDMSSRAEGLV